MAILLCKSAGQDYTSHHDKKTYKVGTFVSYPKKNAIQTQTQHVVVDYIQVAPNMLTLW